MKTYATLRFKGCFYKARFMFPVWKHNKKTKNGEMGNLD